MKVALYIEDGVTQVVLTPETDAERRVMTLVEKASELSVYRGSFRPCQGGWTRSYFTAPMDKDMGRDDSVILVCRAGGKE